MHVVLVVLDLRKQRIASLVLSFANIAKASLAPLARCDQG